MLLPEQAPLRRLRLIDLPSLLTWFLRVRVRIMVLSFSSLAALILASMLPMSYMKLAEIPFLIFMLIVGGLLILPDCVRIQAAWNRLRKSASSRG